MKFVGSELQVYSHPLTWRDYLEISNIDTDVIEPEETGFKKKHKKTKIFTFPIREDITWDEDKKGPIKQISVLQQKHENLCGFHALHCIKEYPNVENMRLEQRFF